MITSTTETEANEMRNLDELLEYLNETNEEIDLCNLPNFGAEPTKNICEIFSWDDKRALISTEGCHTDEWEIVDRTDDFGGLA